MLNKKIPSPDFSNDFSKIGAGLKEILKKLPWIFGEHSFLVFLILVIFASILGSFLFYKYSVLPERIEFPVFKKQVQFNEEFYQKVLKEWDRREKRFKEAGTKEYPNLFSH